MGICLGDFGIGILEYSFIFPREYVFISVWKVREGRNANLGILCKMRGNPKEYYIIWCMSSDGVIDNSKKLTFADKLKMIMAESGWKQSEIAKLLDVGQFLGERTENTWGMERSERISTRNSNFVIVWRRLMIM